MTDKAKSPTDWLFMGVIALVILASIFAVGEGMLKQIQMQTVDRHWYEGKTGFDQALAEHNKTGKPMVVYIYAPWCPHCKEFNESVVNTDAMTLFLGDYVKSRVYPDKSPEVLLMHQFGASGFPTFFVKYKNSPKFYRIERYVMDKNGQPQMLTAPEFIQSVKDAEDGKSSRSVTPEFDKDPDKASAKNSANAQPPDMDNR